MDDNRPPTLIEQLRNLAGVSARKREFHVRGASCEVEVQWQVDEAGERIMLLASLPDAGESAQGGYRGGKSPAVESSGPIALYLREETGVDRIRKILGHKEEIQTGDAELDAAVYIETQADRRIATEMMRHKGARTAILQLLRLGCSSIILGDWSGKIVVHVARPEAPCPDPSRASQLVSQIDALRAALPPVVQRQPAARQVVHADNSPRLFGRAVLAAVVSATVSGVLLALGTYLLYLFLTPDRCFYTSFGGDGVSIGCEEPSCCEPVYLGLSWGLPIVLCLWLIPLGWGLRTFPRAKGQPGPWHRFGAMIGAAVPIGLALGVLAARLVIR